MITVTWLSLLLQCHEVKVSKRGEISPELLSANIDDVVAWTFDRRKPNDVYMLGKGVCNVSYNDSLDRKGKKAVIKYDVNEGFELDAKAMAGEVMKPR